MNEDHLQEEERDVLPAFRDHVDRARREELGLQWVAFHAEHQGARGLSGENADPQTVLEQHDRQRSPRRATNLGAGLPAQPRLPPNQLDVESPEACHHRGATYLRSTGTSRR